MTTKTKPINIEVLEVKDDKLKVRTPFLDIPIEMSQEFFHKRLECSYFNIKSSPRTYTKDLSQVRASAIS